MYERDDQLAEAHADLRIFEEKARERAEEIADNEREREVALEVMMTTYSLISEVVKFESALEVLEKERERGHTEEELRRYGIDPDDVEDSLIKGDSDE
jgi:hypothetical protein